MPYPSALTEWFRAAGRVLVGYSGGVDSAVLAVAGTQATGSDAVVAVLGRSASLGAEQLARARSIVELFGVTLVEIDTHELDDPLYRANAPDRCFFCKHELWSQLQVVADQRGVACIADGMHTDDMMEHRPGRAAGAAHHIRSPFVELGWSKADVRAAAKALGVPWWDAPSSPCLASRIRYGVAVTEARLGQVDTAERWLRSVGIRGDLRVRHLDTSASIEVSPAEHPMLQSSWPSVVTAFAAMGFHTVTLDARGYRRGGLLADHDTNGVAALGALNGAVTS